MRMRAFHLLAWVAMLGAPPAARAAECLNNGQPINNLPWIAAQELQSPSSGLSVFGEPFATLTTDQLGIYEWNCSPDCAVSINQGETRCGDLGQDPVEYSDSVTLLGVGITPAFVELAGGLAPNGKWSFYGQAVAHPDWAPAANYHYGTMQARLGTREVFDVASSAAGPQPVRFQLVVGGHLGVRECQGTIFRDIPNHSLYLRIRERTSGSQRYYNGWSQFVALNEVLEIQAEPGEVLQVDLLLDIDAEARTGPHQDPLTFESCMGELSIADFAAGIGQVGVDDAYDGMQLFVSAPAPMTLTPRSGLVYETVPEPASGAAAAGAALLGLARRRRARG